MAGDWIKVEHATRLKPEMCTAAELLGVSRREAVGIFIDYWCWLDENLDESRNGFVTQVSRKSLEATLHCAGFAAVLEHIGWGSFDDKQRILHVINWEHHNGTTAKTRALAQKRAQRFRNGPVTVNALPEKRREEKRITTTSNTKTGRKRPVPIPEGFVASDRVKAWAQEKGYGDTGPYLEMFIGRNVASGKQYVNWDQTLMNAIREDWYSIRGVHGHKSGKYESRIGEQERVMAGLTGKGRARTD